MKIKYIIVGSDNFWYACSSNLKQIKEDIENIKENITDYADPENGKHREELPETLYVYKVEEIDRVDLEEEEEEENSCRKCGKIIPDGYDMCQACEKERR